MKTKKVIESKYEKFQKGLNSWFKTIDAAKEDTIERLKDGPVDITEFHMGCYSYFIISQETSLYLHRAYLDGDGVITVDAGETPNPDDNAYELDWVDISQDIPTLNDFMDCIYNQK